MHSNIASEIWGELKRFVNTVDRDEAADTMTKIQKISNQHSREIAISNVR
jgi:hypothetical protein